MPREPASLGDEHRARFLSLVRLAISPSSWVIHSTCGVYPGRGFLRVATLSISMYITQAFQCTSNSSLQNIHLAVREKSNSYYLLYSTSTMTVAKSEVTDTEVKASQVEMQEESAGNLVYSCQEEKQALWRLDIVLIPLYAPLFLSGA